MSGPVTTGRGAGRADGAAADSALARSRADDSRADDSRADDGRADPEAPADDTPVDDGRTDEARVGPEALVDPEALVERAEAALAAVESLPGTARDVAHAAVAALVEVYGEGLARVVDVVAGHAPDLADPLTADELVGHLLALHGLHPDPELSALGVAGPVTEAPAPGAPAPPATTVMIPVEAVRRRPHREVGG